MKNLLIYIAFVLSSFSCSCQKSNIEEQKKLFNSGNEAVKMQDLKVAHNFFSHAYTYNPENEIGNACLKKIDSIRPLLRESFTRKILGLWKVYNYDSEYINELNSHLSLADSYLIIGTNELIFFKYDSNSKYSTIIRKEEFKFNDEKGTRLSYFNLIFSNDSCWSIGYSNDPETLYVEKMKCGKIVDHPLTIFYKRIL